MEEFPVIPVIVKSRALISKYMIEQGIRFSRRSEIFKSLRSDSSFFDLVRSNLSVSDKFGIVISFSATYVLAVSAQDLLKGAIKSLYRGKETRKICIFDDIFLNQKRWRASKTI